MQSYRDCTRIAYSAWVGNVALSSKGNFVTVKDSKQIVYRLHLHIGYIWSLFGLLCTAETTLPPPLPPHLDSYTMALLVSQDRRHLFVTPCIFTPS
jgi:hypothetical protein